MAKLSTYPTQTPAAADLVVGLRGAANLNYTAADLANLGAASVEITASATLALTHAGKFISANHASTAINITVPPNSSVAFAVDTEIHIRQAGAAAVAIVAGSGVTVSQPASQTKSLKEQYAVATLKKVSTDAWALFGMLGAA
jgi:hypothetical protein